jgi:hypothetical protein
MRKLKAADFLRSSFFFPGLYILCLCFFQKHKRPIQLNTSKFGNLGVKDDQLFFPE